MSLAALVRRPADLLAPAGGAALMLLVLGPGIRGAAAAVLAAAAALAVRLRPPVMAPPAARPVRVLDRLEVAPRVTVVLLETGGRRYLVSTGASVTPLPLEDTP
jgi:hypothetical protein